MSQVIRPIRLVWILLAFSPRAPLHANEREVAIVSLDAQGTPDVAIDSIRDNLSDHPSLSSMTEGNLSRALSAPLPPSPLERALSESAALQNSAELALDAFDLEISLSLIQEAKNRLVTIEPNPSIRTRLANLEFLLAQILLRQRKNNAAFEALGRVHRLHPEREDPDQIRFPPELIRLYQKARSPKTDSLSMTVNISATMDESILFIDGYRFGSLPMQVSISEGPHDFLVIHNAMRPLSKTKDVVSKQPIVFDQTPKSLVERAIETRRSWISVPETRTRYAQTLASILGVDALITTKNSPVLLAMFDAKTQTWSKHTPLRDQLGIILSFFVPPRLGPPSSTPAKEKNWIQTKWGIATLSAVLITTAGVIFLSTRGSSSDTFNSEVTFF